MDLLMIGLIAFAAVLILLLEIHVEERDAE